jgi:hypothetical protein
VHWRGAELKKTESGAFRNDLQEKNAKTKTKTKTMHNARTPFFFSSFKTI